MEQDRDFDYRIFDSLIEKNIRFAIFRLARQKEINLILQTSQNKLQIERLSELNKEKGFVIAPFHITGSTPVEVIGPDVHISGENKVFEYLNQNNLERNKIINDDVKEQSSLESFEKYSTVYNTFHSALTNEELQKVVLSRTFDVEKKDTFSAGLSFQKACDIHKESFVFLSNTPETGAWMGISPELLVSEKNDVYKTVALAGTKMASTPNWDDKNRKEQQIVVDYMQQQIEKIGGDILRDGPFTAQAGKIEHLKTKFTFSLKEDYSIGDLLELLHPSPAVCGFPKKEAFDFILENESYDRRYYSGFIGPLNVNGISRLYVNLRCMQIGDDILRLYAGGGMLLSSELKSEWEETENKLQTIISVISPLNPPRGTLGQTAKNEIQN